MGNFPSHRADLNMIIEAAVARGIIIMLSTQCKDGAVQALGINATRLTDQGVIVA
jgi:L-asparaginase/Glu-tRNA(Gln) amidotransferase subunit D